MPEPSKKSEKRDGVTAAPSVQCTARGAGTED